MCCCAYNLCTADECAAVKSKLIFSKLPKSQLSRRSNLPAKCKLTNIGSLASSSGQSAITQVKIIVFEKFQCALLLGSLIPGI